MKNKCCRRHNLKTVLCLSCHLPTFAFITTQINGVAGAEGGAIITVVRKIYTLWTLAQMKLGTGVHFLKCMVVAQDKLACMHVLLWWQTSRTIRDAVLQTSSHVHHVQNQFNPLFISTLPPSVRSSPRPHIPICIELLPSDLLSYWRWQQIDYCR